MAEIGNKLNLVDVAKGLDPDGTVGPVAEIVNESNPILDDIPWKQGNLLTGHRIIQRASLPGATWRKLNEGVVATKGTKKQVDETCAMLEAYGECDKKLADLGGNTAAFRAGEDAAHIEGMSQEFVDTLMYGDTASTPEEFRGLCARTSTVGTYVLDGGGSDSDNTSIYLVGWGPVYGIFPKGTKAGLNFQDLGEVTLGDATNGYYQGYRPHYSWDCGFAVEDTRYLLRIANIDVSDIATFGSSSDSSINLINYMIQLQNLLPNTSRRCNPVFYVNKTIKTWLDIMVQDKHNVYLTMADFAGRPVTYFRGFPVRQLDAITDAETAIS